jgi:hypothetical protein
MFVFTGNSVTIILNYNTCDSSQSVTKTHSIPPWTTSVFSFTVTDLVLIYESVTSSISIVRWLTLHSWQSRLQSDWRTNELLL